MSVEDTGDKSETSMSARSGIEATVDLSDCRVAFCDSLKALDAARTEGLPHDTRIRTSSPAVLQSGRLGVEPIDVGFPEAERSRLRQRVLPLAVELFQRLDQRAGLRDYALTVARVVPSYHKIVYLAACLEHEDLTSRRALLWLERGAESANCLNTPVLAKLLTANPELQSKSFRVAPAQRVPPPEVGLLSRIRARGWQLVVLKCLTAIWMRFRFVPSPLVALVLKENELSQETAYYLAMRGSALHHLKWPEQEQDQDQIPNDVISEVAAAILPSLQGFLADWVTDSVIERCKMVFLTRIAEEMNRQYAAKAHWKDQLNLLERRGRTIVLSNHPGQPEAVSLAQLCRQRDIPFFAFQHGIAREICGTHDFGMPFYENSVSDLLFTFNDEARAVSEAQPFARGRCQSVGLPNQYSRRLRAKRTDRVFPLMYISTCVYRGEVNLLQETMTDGERAQWETDLLVKVLEGLPHRVLYKSYPATARYPDPDPVLDRARDPEPGANVFLFEQPLDLRYMIDRGRVLITTRATSTLGWCLMSGKPVVLIDIPTNSPLIESARTAFDAGIFLFDSGSQSFHANLRSFLMQPIEAMERAWAHKSEARAQLITRYFSSQSPNAGRRAAAGIAEHVMSQRKSQGGTPERRPANQDLHREAEIK